MNESLTDENETTINQITLDCLLNRSQYERYLSRQLLNKISQKDRSFYRKRAVNLTKELLKGHEDVFVSPDVKYAFECYIKTCVRYFKTVDKSDLIQEEYQTLRLDSVLESDLATESSSELKELDEIIMRKINLKHNGTLDNFVKIKLLTKEEVTLMPQKKKFNLKDPILRNKGIGKKKNVDSKYNEKQTVEKEDEEIESKDKDNQVKM